MKSILMWSVFGTFLFVAAMCFAVEEITTTEFSSSGLTITKVMTNPKKLNALGKMAQFGDSNAAGKHTELSKDLLNEQQGEELIIKWKYTGTAPVSSLTLRLEYITGKNPELCIYEKSFTSLKAGTYSVVLKNIGASYDRNGEIAHWRVSLLDKNQVFAYRQSRMWGIFQTYADRSKGKS